ncbi:type II secretion system protein [Janthinobacterium agaricidamnosum]|uniref:Putative transmembrane protein n=1 Tax=Janthinobacterium agaricidamnosum NBRC 102515 = DSM 9628 TaxID=1349767 RepID=W0V292_9BURK|nr:type II secretion system protein [Janthinobacterium agaricidamnosum]CDG81981.1 putative transmembrane protein [Janthinobacterium agaricidamnosum NBRC 102515 = DSM 9628]
MPTGERGAGAQAGFTYVAMLFALAIFGVLLAALGESWSAVSQREKEEELIQVGSAYARAIGSYYARSPGAVKHYPAKLEELIEDRRFVGVERHLRSLYADPLNQAQPWGLVPAQDGGIAGVYSLSDKEPLRKQPLLLPGMAVLAGARYSEWKFVYREKQ